MFEIRYMLIDLNGTLLSKNIPNSNPRITIDSDQQIATWYFRNCNRMKPFFFDIIDISFIREPVPVIAS